MKAFYSNVLVEQDGRAAGCLQPGSSVDSRRSARGRSYICSRARIAVYDASPAAPEVIDVDPAPVREFIEALSVRVHETVSSAGGSVPFTVIREVVENFIHADFAEPVVSILDHGCTLRFADQGPGIADKDRALLPGFTTARGEMKRYIRGVGSGLPIVRDYLVHSGGSLSIEDNLGAGSVVTIRSARPEMSRARTALPPHPGSASPEAPAPSAGSPVVHPPLALPRITARQKRVLALVLESGLAGPSLVAKQLAVGVSTAYRDLALLEELGLIASDAGKRTLTPRGLSYLGDLMNHS